MVEPGGVRTGQSDDHPSSDCPFCWIEDMPDNRILLETRNFYVRYDNYPATPGHVEIVPKRHVLSFFDLHELELHEAHSAMIDAKKRIDAEFQPDAYNIGINDGTAAGRSIDHLHIHLIPRYTWDSIDPRAGIRRGLPNGDPDLWA